MTKKRQRFFVTLGWWGYFACATVYVVAGVLSGDWLGLLGSVFFLGATICFLIPHYQSGNAGEKGEKE